MKDEFVHNLMILVSKLRCTVGLGEIGLVDLKFKIKTAPLGFGQEI